MLRHYYTDGNQVCKFYLADFVSIFELKKEGLKVKKEVPIPVYYENEKLELGFRLDLLVENKVIIEVKSVEKLAKVHHKQVLTYLNLINS
jgi:GxxExxY protein